MANKTKIVVSRRWAHPEIEAFLLSDSVGARMSLDDFVDALIFEVGDPLLIFTRKQLRERMLAAAAKVSTEMKTATKHVV